MSGFGGGCCAGCGKSLGTGSRTEVDKPAYFKCIKCGLIYCSDCWEPDFVELCPRCSNKCR